MRLLLALFVFCLPSLAQEGSDKVSAQILANRETIQKGDVFQLGIKLTMKDHWHTYYINSGMSGLPTSWVVEEVPGLKIEALRFPLPKKFDESGFITYGYDDEALLIADAVYTGDATEIDIKAKIDWLQCKELCIPGSADGNLKLKVGNSTPANQEIFDKYLARLEKSYSDAMPFTYSAELSFSEETWSGNLVITPKAGTTFDSAGTAAFFPLADMTDKKADLTTNEVSFEEGSIKFNLGYDAFDTVPADFKVEGVVQLPGPDGMILARVQLNPEPGVTVAQTNTESSAEGTAVTENSRSAFIWLIIAFFGGMLLNLMPCVLPVLSIKVFGLIKEAGESTVARVKMGWSYTMGVLASFMVIAAFFVSAKLAGEQLDWGFQFQNPKFVVAISVLIFVMALSFFGVYQIGSPNADKIHKLSMKNGLQGAFFQGILTTILSTPCTAPGLGALYGWVLGQSPFMIMVFFAVVALGLAFPYLLLCYAPSLMRFLPKPGAWMESFKVAMGFLLVATVIWLFSVLIEQTGGAGAIGLFTLLLFLSAACYIYGKSWYSESRIKGLIYVAIFAFAGVYLGLFRIWDVTDPTKAKREYIEDLRLSLRLQESDGELSADLIQELEESKTTADKIKWVPYTPESLAYFREKNRIIFLDFTAAWCLTCKANEKLIINKAGVRSLFAEKEVVTMKVDYTDRDPELTAFIQSFDRAGVPLYLVYPGQGDAILLPEVITKGLISDAVDKASLEVSSKATL